MLLQDIRYALRSLWHTKGFAVTAILCLGFGIGLNSTIFSVVDGVLLKPFPYHEPDRIVVVNSYNRPESVTRGLVSSLDFRDYQAASTQIGSMAGVVFRSVTISGGSNEPERFAGAFISWNLFPLLGVAPVAGQPFTAANDQPGAQPVVLLSDLIWSTRYNRDPNLIGQPILVNGKATIVVGVMSPRFEFPESQKLWLPLRAMLTTEDRGDRSLSVFARLKPGVSVEQASTEIDTLGQELAKTYPQTNKDWSARVVTLREEFIPDDVTLVILLMMGAATIVMFVACSNVANLQLARASTRRREISVRAALGAGRGRIITQLLTESVVLSMLSLPLGLLIAQIGTKLIAGALPPDDVPYYIQFQVDARSVLFTVVVAVGTAVLFGLFPALNVSRGDLHGDLKEGMRGTSVRRSLLRSGLVVTQVALALVSLVGAMLFVRSFTNLNVYQVGFDPAPLMTMRYYMIGDEYQPADSRARRVQDIIERVERQPGVVSAFSSNLVPLDGGGGGGPVLIDGAATESGREPGIALTGVTPNFVKTLGLQIIRGRDFAAAEGWSRTPVALVNETMATRLWAGREPVGGRFRLKNAAAGDPWFTVVGVIRDFQQDEVDPESEAYEAAYIPYMYQQSLNTGVTIRVAAGDPTLIAPIARAQIRASDTNLAVFAIKSMEELRRDGFWQYALFGWIFGTIGVVGLLLASVGVYGVLSYAVTQRTQEIGVRVALGATRRTVLALIIRHGMVLAGVGVVLGAVLSAIAMPAARSLLYNVSPFDPITFIGVSIFLLLVAFVASALPGLRATKVDPLVALRRT